MRRAFGFHGGAALGEFGVGEVDAEDALGDVDLDGVALLDQGDSAGLGCLGRDVADAEAGVPAGEAAVGDEGAGFAEALGLEVAGGVEYLLHAGATARAFVADEDDIAGNDLVTELGSNSLPATPESRKRSFGGTALCLLFPALIFTWKARTSRHKAWRRDGPIVWAIFAAILLLSSSGCGGGSSVASNLRFSPSGAYQYQVTASSVSGVQITHAVTLDLTVQ